MAGQYTFYSGNNATGTNLGSVSESQGQSYNLTQSGAPIKNDEARSVILSNVSDGATLIVSDDPNGSMTDDWCVIVALKNLTSYTVGSFESSYQDASVRVTYFKNNGLDGKVSHIATA
ncbi:MAG: hypothetical protein U0X75_15765 [Acidobacteriota bacterium]